jgi:spore germination cell wall hydrolase CwlJ-like protein
MTLNAMVLCLALNIFHEAGNESIIGQRAIAHVTINRVHSDIYPNNVCKVVYQPNQFSWTSMKLPKPTLENLVIPKKVAREALLGRSKDPTHGATHFHNRSVNPRWNLTRVAVIGNHIFYK